MPRLRDGSRVTVGLALLAVVALVISVAVGSVASASGDGSAVAAKKKKCHHKKKGRAAAGKKVRRCKKKQATNPSPPPLVRATLTWSGGAGNTDFDLWVFDSSGNKARAASNPIPNTAFSPNVIGAAGTETFTDLIFVNPGARNFSYGVCYQDGGSLHVVYKIDYVTADGVHHTDSRDFGSDGAFATYPGGAPIPATFCKA
jgi:hypothetical protein